MESKEKSFLPDFCTVSAVLAVVVSAVLLAMVLALASTESLAQFWSDFSVASLYIQWVALTSTGLFCLLRGWLGRMTHARAGAVAWLLILLVALAVTEATVWLMPVEIVAGVSHADLLVRTLGISAILGALMLRYLYENHQQKQRELAESRARYQALQARIRPHFLFNSLNTVVSLIPGNPGKAEEVLCDLSDLFRASLGDERKLSTLVRELELTRQYLAVEQQRLGGRLRVTWDLDELPSLAPMPALMLQPLVENAVYHGVEPATGGGEIRIYGRYRNGVIALSVSNSLPLGEMNTGRKGNHMALKNIRQRLAVQFGHQAGMSTGMVDDYYQVRIWFPVVEQQS